MRSVPHCNRGPVDMHVHVVGNGLGGSGCWSRLNFYRRAFADFLLRAVGVEAQMADPAFDDEFAERLAALVRDSSLSHAVILAHEEVYQIDGTKLDFGSFHTPNDWVLELGRRHPQLLPAVSIHPARKDAVAELERCAAAGAVMLKLLPPCHNVDCSLPAYAPFWEKMAELGMPLLSHTGGEYTVPVVDKKLFTPEILRLPLACGVTVIAAHAGTRSAPPGFEQNHVTTFLRMLEQYPNLLGDNSALNTPNRNHGLRACLRPEVQPRIVHGSDFPVPVGPLWPRLRRLITAAQRREAGRTSNPLERDLLLKRAMGFAPAVFTRVWKHLHVGA